MATQSPPPVYAEDTSLTELGTAELFVVTVLRTWLAAKREPDNSALAWESGFAAAGIGNPGALAFGCFMDIIASTAIRTIRLRPLHCRTLGRDEARLLQLVSLLQRDRRDATITILAEWLPPAAVWLAERVALALAEALAEAKLIVPLRHAEAAHYRGLTLNAYATPGLAFVH